MRPSAPCAHEPTLPISTQVAPPASRSPRRDLPCTQRSCQSGLRGAELWERFAVPLGLVFHRGLGSSRRYRRGGSKAPGSPQPRARSRCRRSSTSRTRGGRAAGPRGGAASGKRGKAQTWRIPVGRNRLPGQCLLQACEGSPALVTARWRRDVLEPQVTASPGPWLHSTSGAAAPNRSSFAVSSQPCAWPWLFHPQTPALAPLSPGFKTPLLLRPGFVFFFKPYSPSWLSPFPGLSERSSWMVPQHTFQRVSSFLSLLHPGHRYLLLGEVVKAPREQPHRGVSTCPGVLHPPPGRVSAVVALGLQGRGSL